MFPSRVFKDVKNESNSFLVASEDIKPGQRVQKFSGPRTHDEYQAGMDKPKSKRHIKWMHGDFWISVESDAAYINHSCNANCYVLADGSGDVLARTEIKETEEITISYNSKGLNGFPDSWIWKPEWSFDCDCGFAKCQRKINKFVD